MINLVQILVDTIFVDRSRSILLTAIYKYITDFHLFPMTSGDNFKTLLDCKNDVKYNMKHVACHKIDASNDHLNIHPMFYNVTSSGNVTIMKNQ